MKVGKAEGGGLELWRPADRPLKSGVEPGTKRSSSRIRATAHMLEEWLPALQGGVAPRVPSFRDGWQVQRVIDAARASSAHAGWVEL
jgi:predicted dehydrogenase